MTYICNIWDKSKTDDLWFRFEIYVQQKSLLKILWILMINEKLMFCSILDLLSNSYSMYNEVTKTLKSAKGPEAWCTPLLWQKWIKLVQSGPFDTCYSFCRHYICFNNIDHFDYNAYQSNIYFTTSKSCKPAYICWAAMWEYFIILLKSFKH